MSVKSAKIDFKKQDRTRAKVQIKADITPMMPEPDDLIALTVDGI